MPAGQPETPLQSIPLSLYIHLPWCVKKCPYCDFNSHKAAADLPEQAYVDALIRDLDFDLSLFKKRPLTSIFFGGGTPSLFSPGAIQQILDAVRTRFALHTGCEITLEANPGTVEQARFEGYRAAGVNRLSLGIQSLDDTMLTRLGRIHNARAARGAVTAARKAGFTDFNLDMMYALPEQSVEAAAADLQALIALDAPHISYYQLTLEPGTPFYHRPPAVPDSDTAGDMHTQGAALLTAAGYQQYEVSAWARPNQQCLHNLNYWQYGDYLGIGAGAHGKLTDAATGVITRLHKQPLPTHYRQCAGHANAVVERRTPGADDTRFEFLMNALRLNQGFTLDTFEQRCGQPKQQMRTIAAQWPQLLECDGEHIRCTHLGREHLDSLLTHLLPEAA